MKSDSFDASSELKRKLSEFTFLTETSLSAFRYIPTTELRQLFTDITNVEYISKVNSQSLTEPKERNETEEPTTKRRYANAKRGNAPYKGTASRFTANFFSPLKNSLISQPVHFSHIYMHFFRLSRQKFSARANTKGSAAFGIPAMSLSSHLLYCV